MLDCGAINRRLALRLLGCTLLALAATAATAADVYRSVDAQGNVSYSDRPQNDDAERVAVIASRAASEPARPQAAAAPQPTAPESEPATAEPPAPQPTRAEQAAERARNCEVARERATRYAESRRLYRNTPEGEREYLSDAEIDEARARAAADVETWCN